MLDSATKRRIDTARDILVGKVPDPKSQVEQITIALIYKFMDDMDAESEEMGGKRKFFTDEFARYGWAKLMSQSIGGHEMLGLYGEGIAKMPENPWYSAALKGEHPRQHLKTYKGALQADAYAGFHHLYVEDIYEAACWAHARRKFHEIHAVHASPITTEALARIGALYAIEEEIRGKPADLRREVRKTRAAPLLAALRTWMEKALRSLSTKSETAAAIRYALSRWRALTRYTEDGLLEIDNSAAERALRAVALGRKNFLFVGSDCGGERAAAMYSLIGSAKLNGLDPELYLRTVLARIADHPITHIQDLLPWNLAHPLQTHSSNAA